MLMAQIEDLTVGISNRLAVGIDAEDGQVREAGGRVALVVPGGPCL
jgi:hypothetical protein